MVFQSILFERTEDRSGQVSEAPSCFGDLLLDQIVAAVTEGKREYQLEPFFYSPLPTVRAIQYRQEVMRDMEDEQLLAHIKSFSLQMATVRRYLGLFEAHRYDHHKKGWHLEAALAYCEAVTALAQDLEQSLLRSRGLAEFRDFLRTYTASDAFQELAKETRQLKAELVSIAYSVLIKGRTVKVRKYEGETDYSTEVEKTFEKFQQGAAKDYRSRIYKRSGMDHVEAQVLAYVAKLFPQAFARLDRYFAAHPTFLDEALRLFDREVQFYVAYLDHIAPMRQAGLEFCYPEILADSKDVKAEEAFDLALADKRVGDGATVVPNDFFLKGPERIFVVSGPNQGGKTTFARMFGQLHHLARLGCPVPSKTARLYLYDRIFTHFEKAEDIANLRGKLEDDLLRIHDILEAATPDSIVIMNEIFTSTTLDDAVSLGRRVVERIDQLDALCVFVTFIDELASLSEKTVSVVSTVVPENPALRTYKIVRKAADGLAYAISIAEKHRLTYDQVLQRVKP